MIEAIKNNDTLYTIAIKAAVEAGRAILEVYHGDDFQVTEKDDRSPLTKADRAAHNVIISFLEKTGIPVLSEEGRDIPYAERSAWERFWLVDPLDGTKEFIKRNGEFTVNIALIESGVPVFGVVYAPVLEKLYAGIRGEGAWMADVKVGSVGTDETESMEADAADPGTFEFQSTGLSMGFVRKSGTTIPQSGGAGAGVPIYRVVASRSHLNSDTAQYLNQLRAEVGDIEIVSKGSSLKLCMVATGEADVYPRLGPTMEWDVAAAHAVVTGAGKQVFRLKKDVKEDEGGRTGAEWKQRGSDEGQKDAEKEQVTDDVKLRDRNQWLKNGELRYNKEDLLNPYFLVI